MENNAKGLTGTLLILNFCNLSTFLRLQNVGVIVIDFWVSKRNYKENLIIRDKV
jgi:hypothetical protein